MCEGRAQRHDSLLLLFFLWLCLLARMDLGKRLFTPAWGPSSASATWRGHDATCPGPASPSHLRRGGGRRKPLTEPETEEAPTRDFNALSPAAKKKKKRYWAFTWNFYTPGPLEARHSNAPRDRSRRIGGNEAGGGAEQRGSQNQKNSKRQST